MSRTASASELNDLFDELNITTDQQGWELLLQEILTSAKEDPNYNTARWEPVVQGILDQQAAPLARVSDPCPAYAAPVHRVHFLKTSWFRYAAAIAIVAGATVIGVLNSKHEDVATTNDNKHLQKDVVPGGDKAVLTLANGQQIILDNAQNGNLAQQGGTRIIKLTNGQLAYSPLQRGQGGLVSGSALYNTISTPRGGQYQIVLPDGSKVWLNAASSIKFPTTFSGATRSVEMTGEIYMEMAKNSRQPFIVKVGGTEVQVLGTSFNINAYSDEESMKTTLIEGSVKVMKENAAVTLQPGQQAQITDQRIPGKAQDDKLKVTTVQTDEVLAWKNGLFSFNNTDLKAIMRQLARWYDVEVEYEDNVPERRFLGEMRRSMTLAAVLRGLERSNIHFSVEGKKIIVKP